MKREFLKELGIEDKDIIDKIMDENGKDINEAKGKNNDTKVDELNQEVKRLNDELKNRDTQLETLKKNAGDNEDLKKQIDALKDENKTALENHEKEKAQLIKTHAIESALQGARVKAIKAALPYIDTDKVTVTDGGVTGLNEQIEALKAADDTKFLFDTTAPAIKGAKPGQPSDKEPKGVTAADIRKMSSIERSNYKAEHPQEYADLMGE